MNEFFQDYVGKAGTILILILGIIIYLIFKIKISPDKVKTLLKLEEINLTKNFRKPKKKRILKLIAFRQ